MEQTHGLYNKNVLDKAGKENNIDKTIMDYRPSNPRGDESHLQE